MKIGLFIFVVYFIIICVCVLLDERTFCVEYIVCVWLMVSPHQLNENIFSWDRSLEWTRRIRSAFGRWDWTFTLSIDVLFEIQICSLAILGSRQFDVTNMIYLCECVVILNKQNYDLFWWFFKCFSQLHPNQKKKIKFIQIEYRQ